MRPEELEQLLFEEEGPTLDFKRDQYPFSTATDDDKSELLKDFLGFVNCWRRDEAFILVGVEEVQGGRSIVQGVSHHLSDHSLQQFVNRKTNRPVRFRYEACEIEGKQVGVFRIELQPRPVFLKRDFGKLKKQCVYVRRGSSTDPTKPADPDEISQMGLGNVFDQRDALLTVRFAKLNTDEVLGEEIEWSADFFEMPKADAIPPFEERRTAVDLPGHDRMYLPAPSEVNPLRQPNRDYFREIAKYLYFHRLFKQIRLVISNVGKTHATDVRLEIRIPLTSNIELADYSGEPEEPEKFSDSYLLSSASSIGIRPVIKEPGWVELDKNEDDWKLEIECGNLQPGRSVWTDFFYVGIRTSGETILKGKCFAGNLSEPEEFKLAIRTDVEKHQMSVDELMNLADTIDEDPTDSSEE